MHDFVALGISLGLGLLIGLQRERSDSHLGGIRTFPLISLLGTLCAMLANRFGWAALFGGFIGVAGSLVAANYLRGRSDPASEAGQTTEIAALLTFALGAYIVNGDWSIAFVAAGIIVVLLHLKAPMHRFVAAMGERDMNAVMQFVVITLIVFPLLPNRPYGPYKVLNPYDIWRMVVLIVAISLSGYVAYKVLGQRAGIFLSGILGGLISSTATTVSYARRSREARGIHALAVFVVVIASAIAYARVLIEIAAVAPAHLDSMGLPLGAMLAWMLLIAVALYFRIRQGKANIPDPGNPAELKSALLFGALYALVIFAVGAAKQHLGESALYGIAIASGLTDMDAITLSVARMVDQQRIDPSNGWKLILVASMSNLAFKAGAGVFLGGGRFGVRLILAFGAGIAGGLLLLFFWH
ncbi:MAG TPA: MgtC/SapB family protein [Candidatus Binatia bacterium]|nr:MgtC/SapB family protein [Candidatus Binatia bacterium]